MDSKLNNLATDIRFHSDHFKTHHTNEFKTHRTMESHKSKKRGPEKCEDDFEKLFYKTISIDNTQSISSGLKNPKTTRISGMSKEVVILSKSKQSHSRANS